MMWLYILVGSILGFVTYGIAGALFGVGLGIAFGISQASGKRVEVLEHKLQLLEAKMNEEVIALKAKVGE